jgi:hypothetical protein
MPFDDPVMSAVWPVRSKSAGMVMAGSPKILMRLLWRGRHRLSPACGTPFPLDDKRAT